MITHHQGTKSGRMLNNSLLLSRQFIWQSYHYLLCVFVSRWPKCWANPGITGGTEMLILPGWLWVGTYLPQQLGLLKLALASHRIIAIHVWVVIDDVDLGESYIENKAAKKKKKQTRKQSSRMNGCLLPLNWDDVSWGVVWGPLELESFGYLF